MRIRTRIGGFAAIFTLLISVSPLFGGATVTIINNNLAGVGFNDPTPAVPVGGNSGTTVGEQRLIAFQHAADLWGATLDSNVGIQVLAQFTSLTCTPTSGVLGSAAAYYRVANFGSLPMFPGTEYLNTWYPAALANKRAGVDLAPQYPDIFANFNSNLNGNPDCLGGTGWYYGLDGNKGASIDLVTVVLHEIAHGLGFAQSASVTTGALPSGRPDVYNRQLLDLSLGRTWDQMTNAERAASAINSRRVVWTGSQVATELPSVLTPGTPLLRVTAPAGIAGVYAVGAAGFGPALTSGGLTGEVVLALDAADGAGPSATDGCSALTNASQVNGNIALVDRGTCGFTIKVKNAQNAGAIGVIVADNVAGSPPAGLGGADPTIVIPSVRISLADGNVLRANLPAVASLLVDPNVYAGADPAGRALMNAPNPVQQGSSISHWDPIAFRNQLMEPSINSDLTHSVKAPEDLTLALFRDIGWYPDADLDGLADDVDDCPNSIRTGTVIAGSCDSGVANTMLPSGCTISDEIAGCASVASSHGQLLSCTAKLLNGLVEGGTISLADKDAIQACVGSSKR